MITKLVTRALLIVIGIYFSNAVFSQAKDYTFEYDGSGNRTARTIYLLKSATKNEICEQTQKDKSFEDTIEKINIRIYPNPTKGIIKVEVPSIIDMKANILVYSDQGTLIKNYTASDIYTVVNLEDKPSGLYIIRISIGQTNSDWKIIKD